MLCSPTIRAALIAGTPWLDVFCAGCGTRRAIDLRKVEHVGSRLRMRRLMLDMSQTDIADALGLTFQQVRKYEKGTNRIGASRLRHISQILQVPVPFFFEGGPAAPGLGLSAGETAVSASYVTDFLATSDGLSSVKAFMLIEDPKLRRAIVRLVEEITPEHA